MLAVTREELKAVLEKEFYNEDKNIVFDCYDWLEGIVSVDPRPRIIEWLLGLFDRYKEGK